MKYKRSSNTAILLLSLSLVAMMSTPSAFANSPTQGVDLTPIVKDTSVELSVERGIGVLPLSGSNIRVYDQSTASFTGIGGVPSFVCIGGLGPNPTALGVNTVWELYAADGSGVIDYHFPLLSSSSDAMKVKFGTGIGTAPGNPVIVTIDGLGTLTKGGAPAGTSEPAYWQEIINNADDNGATNFGVTVPSTSRLGGYATISCGTEDEGALIPAPYTATAPFTVQLPVGGSVIQINAASLFVAGISNSVIWLLPLVGAAGGAFALLKFQVNRKDN